MMNIRIIGRNEPTAGIVSRLFNASNKGVFDGKYSTQFTERGWKSFSDLHKL